MNRLQAFAADLLASDGALVEAIDPDGLDIVAPPHLQQTLGIPDLCRFGFGATLPPGARRVGIETDWLARFAAVIGERGRWTRRVLRPTNPPLAGVERLLEREVVLANATYRLHGVSAAWTRYLILDFRFTALSDEKREGLVRLGINLATGAMFDGAPDRLSSRLETEAAEAALPEGVALPPLWDRRRILDRVGPALRSGVETQVEAFAKSLQRRLSRDQARLHGYHNLLFQETMRRMAAAPESEDRRRREELRAEAIRHEYRARIDDLGHKYALRITAEWAQTLELVMPVQRVALMLRRRKAERLVHLDWNPLTRRLEFLPCEFGHTADRARLVCDDALHLVSPAGLTSCDGCAKPYCRACYPERCPKCGHAEHRASPVPTA